MTFPRTYGVSFLYNPSTAVVVEGRLSQSSAVDFSKVELRFAL